MNTFHVAAFDLVPSGSKFKVLKKKKKSTRTELYTLKIQWHFKNLIVMYKGGHNFVVFGKEEKRKGLSLLWSMENLNVD